jgi:hypothetical protein
MHYRYYTRDSIPCFVYLMTTVNFHINNSMCCAAFQIIGYSICSIMWRWILRLIFVTENYLQYPAALAIVSEVSLNILFQCNVLCFREHIISIQYVGLSLCRLIRRARSSSECLVGTYRGCARQSEDDSFGNDPITESVLHHQVL